MNRVRHRVIGYLVAGTGVLTLGTVPPSGAAEPALVAETAEQCSAATPRSIDSTPSALLRLAAEQAWEQATGAGITVAVVDSGVDTANAHLSDAVLDGIDVVGQEGDRNGHTDTAGHGTAVAGEIAARQVEGSGVVGLAPESMILPVRVYYADDDQAEEAGTAPDANRIAQGIRYATRAGAQVINVSMSTPTDTPDLRAAVQEAAEAGSLVVASAGNRETSSDTSDSARYPAAYPDVLAVTAVDGDGNATDAAIHGEHIDVAAPGTDVLTAFFAAGDCVLASSDASTSFATAYVSAAAALIAERYPQESPAQWAYRLEVTALRTQPDERDDVVGWGVIRPDLALSFVDDGTAAGPVSPQFGEPPTTISDAQVVDATPRTDPLASARSTAVWWAVGGVSVVLLAVLATRFGRRRPNRG